MFGGRSNFGNFFLRSPRAKEAGETRELYDRVHAAFAATRFSNDEFLRGYIYDIVRDGGQRAGGYPIAPLGEAAWNLVAHLLREDGINGFPTVPSFDQMSIEDGMQLRRYLKRKEQFLSHADHFIELWRQKVVQLIEILLKHLPDGWLVDDEESAHAVSLSTGMSAPLMDLCYEPAEAIERAIAALFDQDAVETGLFEPVREVFNFKLMEASGIDPQDVYNTHKPLIFPTQSRLTSPAELVAAYCAGTALEEFFETRMPFAVPFPARFEHTHIIGGSGHGKTQLMQSMIYDDLLASQEDGRSVVVIDSQGDLINTISHRALFSPDAGNSLSDRLVLIDPTDIAFPICLNLFDYGIRAQVTRSPVEREKVLNSAIGLYEYIFGALLGAELTQKQGVIFRYLARLMLEIPNATIHTLGALMEDGQPFRPYMEKLTGSARQFFATRFFDRSFSETKKQILTRLWGVLSNSTLERIFGNPRNKVDLFHSINTGKIILINTAKDFLTQEGATLFGRFFIALISQAALQRAAIPAHERRACFVYIDEAADYFDDTIEQLLNQARKYKVGLILAHQNLDQLSTGLRGSLMASTSVKFAGGVSAKDARALSEEMHVEAEFLQRMRKRKEETEFACYVRQFTPRATAVTAPLGRVEKTLRLAVAEYQDLLDRNHERYCTTLEEILAAQPEIPEPPPKQEHPKQRRSDPPPAKAPEAAPKGASQAPQEAPREAPAKAPVSPRDAAPKPTTSTKEQAPQETADTRPVPASAAPDVPVPTPPAPEPAPELAPTARLPEQPVPREPAPPAVAPAPPSARQPRKAPPDVGPAPLGRGGKQHKYLQQLIKQMAEERGWRAVIEDPILDAAGRVDVSLALGTRRIACEISVSSTKDQELGNVEKCVAAGYLEVVLIATNDRQRHMLQKYIGDALDESERSKVRYLLVEELLEYLGEPEAPSEQRIRGYRVKVKHLAIDPADAEAKRQAIAEVIARSLVRSREQ